jgi:hypothetical protein
MEILCLSADPGPGKIQINQGNLFCSVPVENMKTEFSIIYITTAQPKRVILDLPYLHTVADRDETHAATFICW